MHVCPVGTVVPAFATASGHTSTGPPEGPRDEGDQNVSSTAKTITWAFFAVWVVFFVVFLAKFHNFVNHPNGGGGGGIFLAISQAALGAAVIMIWRLRGKET